MPEPTPPIEGTSAMTTGFEPPTVEEPSMSWTKAELMSHALGRGLSVNEGMTKQQILDVINGVV